MAATSAAKNRKMRQEALREFLSNQKLVEKVIDNARKMEEQAVEMTSHELQALKHATDTRMKMISKYLPDLKAVEHTGEGGADIGIDHTIKVEFVGVEHPASE